MNNFQAIMAARESAQVERCHTLPHHGSYTVGQHSYGALALLLLLHPSPSLQLIKAVAFHDLPERWTGDIPGPMKIGKVAEDLWEMEEMILADLGLQFELDDVEALWLKMVDILDLWFWASEQADVGNQVTWEIVHRTERWLREAALPIDITDILWKRSQRCRRLPSTPGGWLP